jgi:hypothetical protein
MSSGTSVECLVNFNISRPDDSPNPEAVSLMLTLYGLGRLSKVYFPLLTSPNSSRTDLVTDSAAALNGALLVLLTTGSSLF